MMPNESITTAGKSIAWNLFRRRSSSGFSVCLKANRYPRLIFKIISIPKLIRWFWVWFCCRFSSPSSTNEQLVELRRLRRTTCITDFSRILWFVQTTGYLFTNWNIFVILVPDRAWRLRKHSKFQWEACASGSYRQSQWASLFDRSSLQHEIPFRISARRHERRIPNFSRFESRVSIWVCADVDVPEKVRIQAWGWAGSKGLSSGWDND